MSPTRRTRGSLLAIAIAALGAAAVAGCGATGGSHAARVPNSGFQFSRCMRANGVPNFPDPGPNGYPSGPASGINLQSPAGERAFNACQRDLPPSGSSPPTPASIRRAELALARCMRANGVSDFPDPNASGNIQFPIGSPIPDSPAFQRASNGPCKRYQRALGP